VICGDDHSDSHQHGAAQSSVSSETLPNRLKQTQPNQEIPPDVKTRHRRVLVDESWRLQQPIGRRVLRDRVDEPNVEESGTSDRMQPQQGRDDQRVSAALSRLLNAQNIDNRRKNRRNIGWSAVSASNGQKSWARRSASGFPIGIGTRKGPLVGKSSYLQGLRALLPASRP
jgi:hypothetical protein